MLRKLIVKIRNLIFCIRKGISINDIREDVIYTKLRESLQREDLSYNEYLRKYFNADSKR